MDGNLNGGDLKESLQCEDSDQWSEESARNEKKGCVSKVDSSSAGTIMRESPVGPGDNDGNALKKTGPPSMIKCEICSCEMSSDLVLSSHINGSRHKKRMKALEIVANLKAAGGKGIGLQSHIRPSAYRCEICSLTVNSPQQLEIHLAGAKHKNRMARGKLYSIVVNVTTLNNQAESLNNIDCPPSKKRKKDGKVLYCDACNITLNSKTQYEQHVLSKKHLGRANGDRKKRLTRLDKSNLMQNFSSGNRFHGNIETDRSNPQLDGTNQSLSSNTHRIHKVHSQQNNRSHVGFSQVNSIGMCNGPAFGNYYQQRPFLNNHRNLPSNFRRIPEM